MHPSGAAVSPFDNINLPSLSQLRVHLNYSGAAGFNLSVIRSLILRSSRNLQRLCIEERHIYHEDLIPCLESVPSLSHLRLVVLGESTAGLSKHFVLMMHPLDSCDSGPPLLPKLAWFHRVTANHLWTCCRRDGYPIATLNAAKIVHHARYYLTDYTTHEGWYGSEH